ncbi:GNAT family N-acetyltransferase [Acetobacter indonesiensis]|uniref:GNAT family N-acetyltransferase n=1 Tax=Acetobacter indonesiensis TaxID=104101 RepID=UPI001F3527E0|nr:GNAT family N-acetyltransferase [Acetobacter indonesiensis]MCG0994692.1 GNAT family N-acetyltransferase [Acetobacter indonesiensis]
MPDHPTLETERLAFTVPQRADFEEFAAMRADPVVARYTSGTPASANDTWGRLLRYRGLWGIMGFGHWTVREKTTNRFVGTIGFGEFHRGLTPSLDGLPEAGWVLASWCHGKGFASEGVRAICHWLDTQTPHTLSRCIIAPENAASLRVAEKNGFTFLAPSRYMDQDVLMFERNRP